MDDEKRGFDSDVIVRVLLCLFLGVCLYLFITNNQLFANGAHNLQHPEALVMFAVLGIPFILAIVHLVRLRRQPDSQRDMPLSSLDKLCTTAKSRIFFL